MTASNTLKVAIYGDVNANIIDGSSVWLRNIVKLTLCHEEAQVWLFLKAPLVRKLLLAELLDHPRVRVIEPQAAYLNGAEAMSVHDALSLIESYDLVEGFRSITLRGMDVCSAASESSVLRGRLWTYITDIPQATIDVTRKQRLNLGKIASASKYVLCQTEELRSHFSATLTTDQSKLVIVPPVVPELAFSSLRKSESSEPVKILYSGKFAPAWATETLVDAFSELHAMGHHIELHVAGDKFHRVKGDPGFALRMQRKLESTQGVVWYGGLPQAEVFELQKKCHLGFGWRHRSMDGSLELSTKLLEYGASGLALITNPTAIHRNLFGEDYPLYASNEGELKQKLEEVLQDKRLLEVSASRAQVAADKYRLEVVAETWKKMLDRVFHPVVCDEISPEQILKVVLAGHDLKFSDELIEYFHARPDVELRIDAWKSLREHDEATSKEMAAWADIVFCEWCAGNAVWYSKNIDSSRVRLLVRFHRFEINTEFPAQLMMENVDKVLFVGPHFQRQALEKFSWNVDQSELVPNFVDVEVYQRPKFKRCEFNLGLIGYVPRLKRLDRALDVLSLLRSTDRRYRLFIKGKHPWEYPYMWRNDEERNFFETQLERIRTDDNLRNAVVFDPFGDDVGHWLRKIGHVLSVSDLESFHLAAAEGIASGAQPVFIDREGVEEMFPWEVVNKDCAEAAERVRSYQPDSVLMEGSRRKLGETYGVSAVRRQLDTLIKTDR